MDTFRDVLPKLSDGKKEYLLGFGEGMACMASAQLWNGDEDRPETDRAKS